MHEGNQNPASSICEAATRLGFDAVGITPLHESEHADFLRDWLGRGFHGDMEWLARPDAVVARTDPRSRWPELRSAIVVTLSYGRDEDDDAPDPSRAIIARYARGRDYHRVMKKRLLALLREIESIVGHDLPAARAYVDTGPVLERELARRAGLGWFGRNTMLIHPRRGSYFFLGTLLTELDIEGDAAPVRDHCGTCNACVEACPTGALLGRDADGAPMIDARRCISYLTIEHRGPIPVELRPLIGNRVFGCDICQEVCPWNRVGERERRRQRLRERGERERLRDRVEGPWLVELMRMTREAWDAWTRGTAVRRAGYAGFKRNVAVAMGNWLMSVGEPRRDAEAALTEALEDEDALVRGHARWALQQIGR
ncbi:MAG: tRNA epoxyqueuosine(34) reductase QueG [Gemmatimonadota bacterium]|jgi:epoxyqueuosine reductase